MEVFSAAKLDSLNSFLKNYFLNGSVVEKKTKGFLFVFQSLEKSLHTKYEFWIYSMLGYALW